MKKTFIIALAAMSAMAASADIIPAKSLRDGNIYFIYDAHGDDGTTTPHDKDTNYRYAFRYDAGEKGIAGNHVKAATAIAEGRTFDASYAWRAVEVSGKWRFVNVSTGLYVTGGPATGDTPATMELEGISSPTQFTLRMAGSGNNRWDGDYSRTGYFWNYQYDYPFTWWEGDGHPYEFYEATDSGAGTYAFADHDRTKIDLVAQRALELKNKGLFTAEAYSASVVKIGRANSNEEALEEFNALLATVTSAHVRITPFSADGILTLSPAKGGFKIFIEYANEYIDGTYLLTASLKNIESGTLSLNGKNVGIDVVSATDAAAEHLQGAIDYAVDWTYSPEPGYMSVSAEADAARMEAIAAQGKSIAAMRNAADALFNADATATLNLPKPGQGYAINYIYIFGLTYNNFLCTADDSPATSRTPQAWLLTERDGDYYLSTNGSMLYADGSNGWRLAQTGTPLQIKPVDEPDENGVYAFTITSESGALAFDFHIMKTAVLLDSDPMPVYLTNMEIDMSGIREIENDTPAEASYDLQGRRVIRPTHGIYIRNGKKIRL